MNTVAAADTIFRIDRASFVLKLYERMELVDKQALIFLRNFRHARGIFFQRLVVAFDGGTVLALLHRTWRYPCRANVRGLGLIRHALQAAHVRFVSAFLEGSVTTIVHAEVHGHRGR